MYTDMKCQQKGWEQARWTIFSTLWEEDGQYLLESVCQDSVIVTNPGMGDAIGEQHRTIGPKSSGSRPESS